MQAVRVASQHHPPAAATVGEVVTPAAGVTQAAGATRVATPLATQEATPLLGMSFVQCLHNCTMLA